MAVRQISLRGVSVHNLKHIDLDLPHRQLITICGVSGSGKTSLALDTLYAEGQRRYIESFSAYTRQFLERLDKPQAERIDGIPPAIAVSHKDVSRSTRATVGTATETTDYLRLLFSRIGQVVCHGCGRTIERDSPERVAQWLAELPESTRYMITFAAPQDWRDDVAGFGDRMREDGFLRLIVDDVTMDLSQTDPLPATAAKVYVLIDRLKAGGTSSERVRDSLEMAFEVGEGDCQIFFEPTGGDAQENFAPHTIDGLTWWQRGFTRTLRCADCEVDYPAPEPRLLSFNSPLGACPQCEGFGNIVDIDMDLIVPDPRKSLREGAIAPWNTPAYKHELDELLALAGDYNVPVDIPFGSLEERHLQLIREGVPERDFGGLNGFFAWLERRKYKMHLRVFLSRWRSHWPCPSCRGARLRPEALAIRVGGKNLAELEAMKVAEARTFIDRVEFTDWQQQVGRLLLDQVRSRLAFLEEVGLGYVALDRRLKTLSGGESQRVTLTSSLGSTLSGMLYVLDEPSVGLHPADVGRLGG
ncbi:MAG: hypothetical protein KDA42_14450, partial [Planctomycetales bacterium]|nr:hypothetical protein [Planctomycetales bacterium]